jgi:hypothetical protein
VPLRPGTRQEFFDVPMDWFPRVADSSSTNAVSFSSAPTTNRPSLLRCASATQIVHRRPVRLRFVFSLWTRGSRGQSQKRDGEFPNAEPGIACL